MIQSTLSPRRLVLTFALAGLLSASSPTDILASDPLPVAEAIKHFQIESGLTIECVAAEPLVVDPVAIRFDRQGQMWVVEMRDYPLGPPEGRPFLSRIRVLTDTDGDGQYDKAQTFAEQLPFCTGIQPWKDGVIVTMAGQVAFFADRDGDGRADFRETWYQGFAEQNSQLRANHPTLGVDHQVYIANGLRGGTVVDARHTDAKPVSISGRDFRFDLLTGKYEAISGIGQFGLTFNDAAERFVCSNRNPLRHIVLENRYLAKAPQVPIRSVVHDAAAWGFDSRVYAISKAWTTSNLHAGQFTAACGVHIYRDTLLGEPFLGSAFTCEPTGNLVHREVMREHDSTYTSKPALEGREFLASDDVWFRPVNLTSGPDGALYVVDMYRAVIEHPQFMPTELKTRPDLRWGDDRGRIYRISPADSSQPAARPDFSRPEQLIPLLNHPVAWIHETAARLLLENREQLDAPALEKLFDQPSSTRPTARIHALWLLDAAGKLSTATLQKGLADPAPTVRRQAIIAAEARLSMNPQLIRRLIELAGDPDTKVRFQVALSLTGQPNVPPETAAAIITAAPTDQWTWAAGRLLAAHQPLAVLTRLLNSRSASLPVASHDYINQLAEDVGRNEPTGNLRVKLPPFFAAVDQANRLNIALGMTRGLGRRRLSWSKLAEGAEKKTILATWSSITDHAEQVVRRMLDKQTEPDAEVTTAFGLLAYAPQSEPILLEAVDSEQLTTTRQLAMDALVRVGSLAAWQELLERYQLESPSFRRKILDGLLARADRTEALVEALEGGDIRFSELDRTRSARLQRHRNVEIRKRVAKVAQEVVSPDRQKLVEQYAEVLAKGGDAERGKEVFRQQCATCHQVAGIGVQVAPDISDSRVKSAQQYLTDILLPNQAIDNNYVSYTVLTTDGRVLSGILTTETVSSVTLKQPEAKTVVLPRSEIEALRSDGISLMPEGLEKSITPRQMADLITFIKNWRYLDGSIPMAPSK